MRNYEENQRKNLEKIRIAQKNRDDEIGAATGQDAPPDGPTTNECNNLHRWTESRGYTCPVCGGYAV